MDKEESPVTSGSPKYWLSLEQWRNDPEFQNLMEREFVSSPFAPEDSESGWARREFLKLMGASVALTSFGCTRKAQKIVPYAQRPQGLIPGLANHYASTLVDGNEVFGTVVTTREGRPIKIEGNEYHPMNVGAMSARAHAAILSLYDPDRLAGPKKNLLNDKKSNRDTIGISWEKLDEEVAKLLSKGKSALLTGSICSPTTNKLINEFTRAFSTSHYTWDSVDLSAVRDGQKKSYGSDVLPRPRFDKANYILSFGADFLGTYLSPTEFTRSFSKSRNPDGEMAKLVVFEPTLSLTGSNADERFRVKASHLIDVVMAVSRQIVLVKGRSQFANNSKVRAVLESFESSSERTGVAEVDIVNVAEELWRFKSESLVVAGDMVGQTEGAVELQIAVNFLNSLLGNDGKTVDYQNRNYSSYTGSTAQLVKLISEINDGKVEHLIIQGVNPVYSAPAGLGLEAALVKLKTLVYIGEKLDETAQFADYVATEHNSLENWGDAEVQAGIYSLQQPTIQPLYSTRGFQDSLISWMSAAKRAGSLSVDNWYDYLTNNWKSIHSRYGNLNLGTSGFDDFWMKLKQMGVYDTNSKKDSSSSSRNFNVSALDNVKPSTAQLDELEFVLYQTSGLKDGTLANISWLQEFPDPVTKICWDNYLCLSPKTANKKGLHEGQIVVLKASGHTLKVPVHVQPGQHDSVVSLAIGYGRTFAGQVANGVGIKAGHLAQVLDSKVVYAGLSVELKMPENKEMIQLANIQGHNSMEGRQIVVESTFEKYRKSPDKVVHRHKMFSLWGDHEYKGIKWAMSVDLNSCTGCGACIMACQSENNIPAVGKKYVLKGREMHWMRVDRYYVGTPDNPDTVFQPVMCQHCDNAPCETVCPVAATVHSDEGTNDMIYNRCVGTRYCANNCPYKVRRFNWFNYTKVKSPLHMAMNPEVTVRPRGVMEKCTFCIHRIKEQKHKALVAKEDFSAASVVTACQQSCPTNAIVFGDMNDSNSEVSKDFKNVRTYSLLEELNAKPAVKYKYKVRNTSHLKGESHDDHSSSKGGHA